MSKRLKKSDGFSVLEVILIIVIVGIIGFVGWYIVEEKSNKPLVITNNSANQKDKKSNDITASWTKVASGTGAFSVKIPDGWNTQNWTSRDYLYAGVYTDLTYAAGKPARVTNSDTNAVDSGPVRHFNITGNPIAQKAVVGNYFNETPQNFGPVSGIIGQKYVHTFDTAVDGVKKGDKVYLYRFEGIKTLITVDYYVLAGEADQTALIEKTIKTLSFE